jgi:hypothetical protein
VRVLWFKSSCAAITIWLDGIKRLQVHGTTMMRMILQTDWSCLEFSFHSGGALLMADAMARLKVSFCLFCSGWLGCFVPNEPVTVS